jgi:hypothetical protein
MTAIMLCQLVNNGCGMAEERTFGDAITAPMNNKLK